MTDRLILLANPPSLAALRIKNQGDHTFTVHGFSLVEIFCGTCCADDLERRKRRV